MNIQIIKASKADKENVLTLLDEFRTTVNALMDSENATESRSARENGSEFYDLIIELDTSAVFLAKDEEEFVGILTIHKIPQLRKGNYLGEIDEMFVKPECQGKGVAKMLLDKVYEWAQKNDLKYIRLESGEKLERAHGFYKKAGFNNYGKAFIKAI